MTFDAVPPGQVPTRMTPMASSGGRAKSRTRAQATKGMIRNWATTPISTSQGRLKTVLKSCTVKVMPMPNMTIPRSQPT